MDRELFVAAWAERLRRQEPDAIAILLKGSAARGDAGPHSDVDFDVLTASGPREAYLAYLGETGEGWLTHVSVAVCDLDSWLAQAAEPVEWAFPWPAAEATRLVWARDETLRERLARPFLPHPPAAAELEDFIAGFGKVKNAHVAENELALRLAAQGLARFCPSLLRLVNPEVRVGTGYEALLASLELPVSPPGYREDLLVCLGLVGRATTVDEVYAAAHRLVTGVVALLQPHAQRLATEFEPDLAAYLADGTLQRYIAQEIISREQAPRVARS
jgi:phosphoribosyl-AMP cyclohydrolase